MSSRADTLLLLLSALVVVVVVVSPRGRTTAAAAAAEVHPTTPVVCEGSLELPGSARGAVTWQRCGLAASRGVVLAFHGYGALPRMWAFLAPSVAERNLTLVAPRGHADRSWNGRVCCGEALRHDVDEASFVAQLLETLGAPRNVFALGFSNGGFVVSDLATRSMVRFRAIAPWAGHVYDAPDAAPPTPVFLNHGDRDATVRLAGCCVRAARCCCGIGPAWGGDCVATRAIFDKWLRTNRCRSSSLTTTNGTTVLVLRDDAAATCLTGVDCLRNTTLCVHRGAGHALPRRRRPGRSGGVVDLGDVVAFFADHIDPDLDAPSVRRRVAHVAAVGSNLSV
mmetsp:Transcript_23651/g.93795  ORF Transcript_23651/g.93795 Transcript_23651/m.93795 type:complete len:338 (-) Transcript_23651:138-1151(-)